MNKIALFLSISLTSQFSLADCPYPISYIKEGATAWCSGYLITPETEKTMRQYESDSIYYKHQYDLSTKLNDKQAELNKNLEDQINVLGRIAEEQQHSLTEAQNNNKYYALGGAILAIILYNNVKR